MPAVVGWEMADGRESGPLFPFKSAASPGAIGGWLGDFTASRLALSPGGAGGISSASPRPNAVFNTRRRLEKSPGLFNPKPWPWQPARGGDEAEPFSAAKEQQVEFGLVMHAPVVIREYTLMTWSLVAQPYSRIAFRSVGCLITVTLMEYERVQ